jgi:hypothetical protein
LNFCGTISLDVMVSDAPIHLLALQDAFLYEHLAMEHLLRDVDGIVYVVCGVYPTDEDPYCALGAESQRARLHMCQRQAKQMGLDWQAIPRLWVVVTNTPGPYRNGHIACLTGNPLADLIPLHEQVLELDLDNPAQVQQVWRAALTLCGESR